MNSIFKHHFWFILRGKEELKEVGSNIIDMVRLQNQNPGGSNGQSKFITVPLHAKSNPSYTMFPVSWKQLPTTPTMRKPLHSLIDVTPIPLL